MKTPIEAAMDYLRSGSLTPSGPARLTPMQAMQAWMQAFAALFFVLFVCAILACVGLMIMMIQLFPTTQSTPAILLTGCLLILFYCLGNILLLQGFSGARLVHGSLFVVLLLGGLVGSWLGIRGSFHLTSLLAALIGFLCVCLPRYARLQQLHKVIRLLRRQARAKLLHR